MSRKGGQKLLKVVWDSSETAVKCHRAAPTGATKPAYQRLPLWQSPGSRHCHRGLGAQRLPGAPARGWGTGWDVLWETRSVGQVEVRKLCIFHEVFLHFLENKQEICKVFTERKTWILLCTKKREGQGHAGSWGRWRKWSIIKASQPQPCAPEKGSSDCNLFTPDQTERGGDKDRSAMDVLPAATSPCRNALGLAISKECLLRTWHGLTPYRFHTPTYSSKSKEKQLLCELCFG